MNRSYNSFGVTTVGYDSGSIMVRIMGLIYFQT